MKFLKLLPLLSLLLFFSSCAVFQKPLAPPKDNSQQVAKEAVKNEMNHFYTDMAAGSKEYKPYASQYASIYEEIDAITKADSVRKDASKLFESDKYLREAWYARWKWHALHSPLNNQKVSSEWDYMQTYWAIVMREENTLQ